jgi:hypothetical protein
VKLEAPWGRAAPFQCGLSLIWGNAEIPQENEKLRICEGVAVTELQILVKRNYQQTFRGITNASYNYVEVLHNIDLQHLGGAR